jgi:fumarate reductase subunit C
MLRELSSLFLALWAVRLLTRLDRLRRGQEGYEAFVAAQRRPAWVVYHLITLLFALLHAVTFLVAAGKGPTPHIRGRRVSEQTIAAGAFAGWAVASLGVALVLLLGGRRQDA